MVSDINKALECGAYLSALSLTLTLPDVCGKAEYPNLGNGERYKRWYDENIGKYETYDGNTNPYLSGEVVYSLRNAYLHQATPNVDKSKIKDSQNQIDQFILQIQPKNQFDIYADTSSIMNFGGAEKKIYYVNVRRLCLIISQTALGYYIENTEKFNFTKYKIEFIE